MAKNKQNLVKKKMDPLQPILVTEMQRRLVDYLVYHEGRTTRTDAAIKAGYAPKDAAHEAWRLMKNPKVLAYYQQKSNEVNRAYKVSHSSFIKDIAVTHNKLEEFNTEGAIKAIAPLLNIKGKATGMFSQTNYNVDVNKMARDAKLADIQRLKEINKERLAAKKLIEGEYKEESE